MQPLKLTLTLLLILLTLIATTQTVQAFSNFRFAISTGVSMKPTLPEHNLIWGIKPTTAADVKVGDIVSFEFNGMQIVHRITDILKDAEGQPVFFAWGDNREACKNGQSFGFSQIKFVVTGHYAL